ncbi:MAG: hypothetical protein IKH11_09025 [Bacteroidales bacterium]|nr:hypothetical protein [Bacteroidales bacterium]
MNKTITRFEGRAYQAPFADVSEVLPDVIICESGETEDWTFDNVEF